MESEKVKEIKEKLQEEIFIANSFGDKLRKVPTKELQNLLTLINELEKEKTEQLKQFAERLKEKCKEIYMFLHNHTCFGDIEFEIDETLKEFIKSNDMQ